MQQPPLWEILMAGALAVLVIFLFRPGLTAAFERSRQAPKDWLGVIIPLVAVVLFVLLLIRLV